MRQITSRRWLTGVLLVAASTVASALTAPAASALPERSAQAIGWQVCPGLPGLQCATLHVPLDWAQPGGQTIGIALVRRPAGDPAQRIGSLLVDPTRPPRTYGSSGCSASYLAASC
jgi:hypothetical protein